MKWALMDTVFNIVEGGRRKGRRDEREEKGEREGG